MSFNDSPYRPLTISGKFNRFYHKLLSEVVELNATLVIESNHTIYSFVADDLEKIKLIFKSFNPDYPKVNGELLTTMKLTNEELLNHIEYIIYLLIENGYELNMLEDDKQQ